MVRNIKRKRPYRKSMKQFILRYLKYRYDYAVNIDIELEPPVDEFKGFYKVRFIWVAFNVKFKFYCPFFTMGEIDFSTNCITMILPEKNYKALKKFF